MKFKKLFAAVLALSLSLSLVACGNDTGSSSSSASDTATSSAPAPAEKTEVRVAALKGPTAIGMVKMMDDADTQTQENGNQYVFTLAGAPDELVGKIVQGDFDIAAVPTNLAATLYNKTQGKVKMAALNTLGVLYLVENGDTVKTVADLKGKTIYASGKGSTPEFALNYILEKNGLQVGTDVKVEYKAEHTELANLLATGQAQLAMLPEPFVTSVLAQNDKLRVALDLTKEWNAATDGTSELTMGCIIVQQKFLDEHPQEFAQFMKDYENSVLYVTAPDNLESAAALTEKYDIMKAAVAVKAIPQCNIVFIKGEEMKQKVQGFLDVLYAANPASVGGTLPDENFYYIG